MRVEGRGLNFQEDKDPQMSKEETQRHLEVLLKEDPALFLERYGQLLSQKELFLFKDLQHDYEVNFWVTKLLSTYSATLTSEVQYILFFRLLSVNYYDFIIANSHFNIKEARKKAKAERARTRNRRLKYMETHEAWVGEYFSMESMETRDPYMYQHYFGKRATSQLNPSSAASQTKLSDFLLYAMDKSDRQQAVLLEEAKIRARDIVEEEDDSDDDESELEEEEEEEMEEDDDNGQSKEAPDVMDSEQSVLRQDLQDEFVRMMREKWLDGLENFDYSVVDDNEALDDIDQISKDAQDRYFDD